MAWNFEHFSTSPPPPQFFRRNFYFDEFLILFLSLIYFGKFLFSRTFLLSLPFSTLIGLSCFRKVKWKMQFIMCFLKSASKSLRSQSLNFPLKSCYCYQTFPLFVYNPKTFSPCFATFSPCFVNFSPYFVTLVNIPQNFFTCYCFD